MTTWYATEKLGETRFRTPEGFLVCENVPIARTGLMSYSAGEVPIEPGPDGIIRIERIDDDVFDPKTIASFAGKPVTNDHPDEDVTPDNWRQLAKGEVHNPRRGTGIWADCLVADLFIKDADAIRAVLDGKVEISCGYDADYEQTEPGRGRQKNIIGNHVALVENGRCGPRCSIGDKAMSNKRKSFLDRMRAWKKTKDEEMEALLNEGEVLDEDPASGAGETHVHVHLNGSETKPAGAADEGEAEQAADPNEDRFSKIEAAISALAEQVAKIVAGEKAEPDEEEKSEEAETKDEDVLEEGETETGKTTDSAGLKDEHTDTLARAEILSPGIKLPTFDAKVGAKKVRDNLCALRRNAMTKALGDDRSAAFVAPFAKDGAAIKAMTCDAARVAFIGASELARNANNALGIGYERATKDANSTAPKNNRDINEANRAFWATRS